MKMRKKKKKKKRMMGEASLPGCAGL